jgi:hypothetical protein
MTLLATTPHDAQLGRQPPDVADLVHKAIRRLREATDVDGIIETELEAVAATLRPALEAFATHIGVIPEGEPGGACAECYGTGKELIYARAPEGDRIHGPEPCETCDGTGIEPHRCPHCDAILRPGSFSFEQRNVYVDVYQIERVGATLVLSQAEDGFSSAMAHTEEEWGKCHACHKAFPLGFDHAAVGGAQRAVLDWEGGLS